MWLWFGEIILRKLLIQLQTLCQIQSHALILVHTVSLALYGKDFSTDARSIPLKAKQVLDILVKPGGNFSNSINNQKIDITSKKRTINKTQKNKTKPGPTSADFYNYLYESTEKVWPYSRQLIEEDFVGPV